MQKLVQLTALVAAVSAVGVADIFLKKAAPDGAVFAAVAKSPWFAAAVGLYAVQIALFAWVFSHGAKLSLVGILQTGLYASITLAVGLFYFGESLTVLQAVGIALTLVGVALLSV